MGALLLGGVLSRAGRRAPGWVEIDGESIVACGEDEPPRDPDERCEGVIAPGLCDLQVNGAGGFDVSTGGAAALEAIDAVQLTHGVTSCLPTLVSPDPGTAERALAAIAKRRSDRSSPVVGAHIEGPFLNPRRRGMHPAHRLRSPADGLPSWLESPAIRLVTLAPELPGALALIERLTARGVRVSLGHSEADDATVRAAIDAGATAVTHVFNAMAPLHHRVPGLAGTALVDERLALGVIADGVHVAPAVLELTRRAAGSRTVLVSDCGPAAAAPPGRYEMAGVTIEADAAGAARTAQGELAGSTVTLDVAMVRWSALTGATLDEASCGLRAARCPDRASRAAAARGTRRPGGALAGRRGQPGDACRPLGPRVMHRSTLGRLALAACVLVVAVLVLAGRSSDPPPDVRSPAAPPIARSPGGAPPAGTMILVHGGSWRGPDSREQARLVRDPGELLLKRRWRIVSVDYARGKAGLRDLLSAVERERPPRGGSPLCLYGESAGGHLSLVAAARQPFVDCVIAAAPPTDFQAYFATATAGTNGVHRAVAGIIRRTFGQSPAATAPWEPVRLARRIEAEVLLLRVSNDPLVPRAQMERFVAARPSTRFVELEEGDLADPAQAWVHGALSARGRRVLRSRLARFVDCAARQRAPTRGRQCQ